MKRIGLVIISLLSLLVACDPFASSEEKQKIIEQEHKKLVREMNENKPVSVPKNAFWQGGVDGGNYFLFSQDNTIKQFHVKIYNDFTGTLEAEGDIQFFPDNAGDKKPITLDELLNYENINYFDGQSVMLHRGSLVFEKSILDK